MVCVSTFIENCGEGIVSSLEISEFFIQNGNKVSIDIRSQEKFDTLCYFEKCNCTENFILLPKERVEINFLITDEVMSRENADFDYAEQYIEEYIRNNKEHNIMLGMSINLSSINDSSYQQSDLNATYVRGKVVHNSLRKMKPKLDDVNNKK